MYVNGMGRRQSLLAADAWRHPPCVARRISQAGWLLRVRAASNSQSKGRKPCCNNELGQRGWKTTA